MIYLFSQIAISLALATIVGGVFGWIAHRARANKQIRGLQQVVGRQQQHVNEAQTEVSILSADFDDLKHRADSEISALKADNQKIPALNQNLEKSQLLVRQLMQQHKAELTEMSEENDKLTIKARQVSDRDKEVTKLQAELDIERRKTRRLDTDEVTEESQAELPLNEDTQVDPAKKHSTATQAPTTLFNSLNLESTSTKLKATESSNSGEIQTITDNQDADTPISTNTANLNNTRSANEPRVMKMPLSGNSIDKSTDRDNKSNALPSAAETEAELKALRDQLALDAPMPIETPPSSSSANRPHKLDETQVDDAQLEQMFDSVDQHDDLKQIFGIGPVTEKTLNKLGITAYSQLAELKQHDIEKIADALQIFPGRIERDNWVGGARTQLEEVLEDL